ncbi:MAG: hypothetical protein VKO21_10350 [Candidatus Sericytochromatia bacterium]|nr:hypothetical protein [Candidatus Sericytochromatia bacterium]
MRGILSRVVIAAVMTSLPVGCDTLATETAVLDPFLFPERLPENIPFPVPADRSGVVTGRVVDVKGNAVAGVRVSNGSIFTFTGNGKDPVGFDTGLLPSGAPRPAPGGAEGVVLRSQLVPLKGQFILSGLPVPASGLGSTTLTFSFDEVLLTRQVEVRPATFSADIPASASVQVAVGLLVNTPFGVPELADQVSLPLTLPTSTGSEAARISLFSPQTLTCNVATPDQVITFPTTGSRVSFGLRNLPGGRPAVIVGARVTLLTPEGLTVGTPVRLPVDPVLLEGGLVNRSGALAQVTIDLALQGLRQVGNPPQLTARVVFLKEGDIELLGGDGRAVERNIPIRIVTGTAGVN